MIRVLSADGVTCGLQVTTPTIWAQDALEEPHHVMTYDEPMAEAASRSPLDEALGRVGDRWSLLVVEALLDRPSRFNELLAAVPGIAPNILSDRLKRLER